MAGIITLLSGFLVKVVPDMTKSNMPITWEDIRRVQFPETDSESPKPTESLE